MNFAALTRFFIGGVLSVAVTLGVTAFMHEVSGFHERVAAAAGFLCAFITNFMFTRFYVFRGTEVPMLRQLIMFAGSSGGFRLLEYGGFLITNAVGVHYLLALLLVMGCSFILKFFVYEKLVFARKPSA
jgi:putative flippase GtrA